MADPRPVTHQAQRWNAIVVGKEVSARFRAGWRAAGSVGRGRWFRTILIGTIALGALLAGAAEYGKNRIGIGAMPGERALDAHLLQTLPFGFATALWIQTVGTDIPLMMVIFIVGGMLAWHGYALEAVTLLLAWVLVYVVVDTAWLIWHRARPDLVGAGLAAPGFSSFPSGHTAKALAVYGVLAYLWARMTTSVIERVVVFVIALALGALAGLGRLRMGAHWPSDIIGGYIVGVLMLSILILALSQARNANARSVR
jgi:membrane-associated phospholipid phosphatase